MITQFDKKRDVIVIGAGASGMMAAISACRKGADVLVLEKMNNPGKKILATGNGRCNMTNMDAENHCYFHNQAFAKEVILRFNVEKTLEFFTSIGLLHKIEGGGRVYPYSEQAKALLDVLEMEMKRLGIQVLCNCTVSKIIREKAEFLLLTEDNKEFHSRNVILATGGQSGDKYGSSGDGYRLAQDLGHTINNPRPSLVQVFHNKSFGKQIKGVRSKGRVYLMVDKQIVAKEEGEIQFTEKGLSGICVFNLSRYMLEDEARNAIVIDFFPDYTYEELKTLLLNRLETAYDKTIEEFMVGIIHKKLIPVILKFAPIKDSTLKTYYLNEKDILNIVGILKGWEILVEQKGPFESSQVTSGGIMTDEINAETCESKIIKGLFFAGEVMDIDGLCGGFNLQWAWSSGNLAGGSYAED